MSQDSSPLILLTGATGYVGGRLLTRLEASGHRVRCLTRRPADLQSRIGPNSTAVEADMLAPDGLVEAMRGGEIAFYLVHSMGMASGFEESDRDAARNFGTAAREVGVRRIVYLGGLGRDHELTSPHLRSRREVGDCLRESGVEVVEFRASVVLGSGSLSFEMLRALVERLPVMIAPRWV
ncbi:MAG TPA: NAD(P)H-binding protein, partial [Thermomicrobiales bacterium]|nr:NAD(P)H-binding protein [Thermomicrobiales bacterium]